MTTGHSGIFVTIDGLGGAGKSDTTAGLRRHLTEQGYTVHATTEPSRRQLGHIARTSTDVYSGYALACLVAADRYDHLTTGIRPRLAAGEIVISGRYVASSYVLQRMDEVPIEFIETINEAADLPDLAVILTIAPEVAAERIHQRGSHSRFEAGLSTSRKEAELYKDAEQRLRQAGYPVLTLDTTHTDTDQVVSVIARRIVQLAGLPRVDAQPA